jgi:hypothetical protein
MCKNSHQKPLKIYDSSKTYSTEPLAKVINT